MCFVISVCFGCFGLSAALCVVARRWGMRGGSVLGLGLFFVRYVLTACRCSNCDIILVVVVAFFFFSFIFLPVVAISVVGALGVDLFEDFFFVVTVEQVDDGPV